MKEKNNRVGENIYKTLKGCAPKNIKNSYNEIIRWFNKNKMGAYMQNREQRSMYG